MRAYTSVMSRQTPQPFSITTYIHVTGHDSCLAVVAKCRWRDVAQSVTSVTLFRRRDEAEGKLGQQRSQPDHRAGSINAC